MNEAIARELFARDAGRIPDSLLTVRNWKIYQREFPVLDVGFRGEGRTEMRVRFVAKDWNDFPPSIQLLNAEGSFLASTELPRNSGSLFNAGPHPSTSRPFICMAGSLEYHTFHSHVSDFWGNYKNRDGYSLGGIMTQLWDAWLKG